MVITHAPNGDAEVRKVAAGIFGRILQHRILPFGHPEKFCSDIEKTNWESATVVTSNDEIISYIEKICKRNPRSGNVVTGGIVSCKGFQVADELDNQQTASVQEPRS